MSKITPADIIAMMMLIGSFVLRGLGVNSLNEYVIVAIGVGYLGWSIGAKK